MTNVRPHAGFTKPRLLDPDTISKLHIEDTPILPTILHGLFMKHDPLDPHLFLGLPKLLINFTLLLTRVTDRRRRLPCRRQGHNALDIIRGLE